MMLLLAPGLFRLDVRPVEDTLQVMTRSLHEGARWGTEPSAATDYGRKAEDTPEPSRAEFTFYAELEPRPVLARIALRPPSTASAGLTHFVAHAIVREVEPGVRSRGRLTYPRAPMDRDEIERQDFPAARRGYDPAAVDAHLRRVADEFERSPPAAPGVARRGRVDPGAARSSRPPSRARSSCARTPAARRAAHVERVEDAAKDMLEKLDRLQAELDRLLERPEVDRRDAHRHARRAQPRRRHARRRRPGDAQRARPPPCRRALRRRGRRPARRAQHGARGHAARGDRPLPRRALRAGRPGRAARRRLHERRQVSARPPELAALHERATILADLGHVHALLFWDQNTMMPPDGARRPRRPVRDARGDRARAADRPGAGPAARRARAVGGGAGPRRRRRAPDPRAAARLREGGARPDQPRRRGEPRRRARPAGVAGGARRRRLLPLPRRARAPARAAPPLRRLLRRLRAPLRRPARRLRAGDDDREGCARCSASSCDGLVPLVADVAIRRAAAGRAARSAARTRSRTSAWR